MKTRSQSEIIFLYIFLPLVVGFYLIYKYPLWFVAEADVESTFYWFGKSTGLNMETINRTAVTITFKEKFMDWVNNLPDRADLVFTMEMLNESKPIYPGRFRVFPATWWRFSQIG